MKNSFLIGIRDDGEFESSSVSVAAGSRLYIFSDGLFEVSNPADTEMLNRGSYDSFVMHSREARIASMRSSPASDDGRVPTCSTTTIR